MNEKLNQLLQHHSARKDLPALDLTGSKKHDLTKASFDLEVLRTICTISIDDFDVLGQRLNTKDGSFIYIYGGPDAKILAVAHRDTVCKAGFFKYDARNHRVYTPTLDDRLGCCIVLDTLRRVLPEGSYDILLTEGEETGRSTAKHFIPPVDREYNWMFQFDRGGVDAVHYQYTDRDWLDALKNDKTGLGCDIAAGMMSDICYLERLGVCGVNVGTAYYKYHSINAFADLREAEMMIDRFAQFFVEYYMTKFEHDEKSYGKYGRKQQYSGSYNTIGYLGAVGAANQSLLGTGQDLVVELDGDEIEDGYDEDEDSDRLAFLNAEISAIRQQQYQETVPMRPKGHLPACSCPPCVNVKRYDASVIAERHAFIYYDGCMCASCRDHKLYKTKAFTDWSRGGIVVGDKRQGGGETSTSNNNRNSKSEHFPLSTTKKSRKQIRKEKRNQQLRENGTHIPRMAWNCTRCNKPSNILIWTQGEKLCDECNAKKNSLLLA
jgi:hypothetical protein